MLIFYRVIKVNYFKSDLAASYATPTFNLRKNVKNCRSMNLSLLYIRVLIIFALLCCSALQIIYASTCKVAKIGWRAVTTHLRSISRVWQTGMKSSAVNAGLSGRLTHEVGELECCTIVLAFMSLVCRDQPALYLTSSGPLCHKYDLTKRCSCR